jgi:hypothetical protein
MKDDPADEIHNAGGSKDSNGTGPFDQNEQNRSGGDSRNEGGGSGGSGGGGGQAAGAGGPGGGSEGSGSNSGGTGRSSDRSEFISYVGAHPEDEDGRDPDGLSHKERMDLEEAAITFIQGFEPFLERTPAGNQGYDLIENALSGQPRRLVEVKAMRGTLKDRPATMSSTQMNEARRSEENFWLYVVERAGTTEARLLKIQNPYRRTGTFTFDHGWEAVAVVVDASKQDAAE